MDEAEILRRREERAKARAKAEQELKEVVIYLSLRFTSQAEEAAARRAEERRRKLERLKLMSDDPSTLSRTTISTKAPVLKTRFFAFSLRFVGTGTCCCTCQDCCRNRTLASATATHFL